MGNDSLVLVVGWLALEVFHCRNLQILQQKLQDVYRHIGCNLRFPGLQQVAFSELYLTMKQTAIPRCPATVG